ncbi:hypothetical protein F4553_000745 [Allocatelliglobosispora scoriae]|uniref:Uncharacterized protein n=1 Tax=Allocatelliglobosispora scoriae TaxID=643052 RepID=A0A841BJI7_9ACTN|nr:hypothetical protein [Allocatelliglobosispora scoriae]MBB5867366.1 hypothetical protein [Allocatelliglobosispora scoriae]
MSIVDPSRCAELAGTAATQAAVLRSAAIRVESAAGGIGRAVAAATFESPSAARFRHRAADLDDGLRAAIRRLNDTAEQLDRLSRSWQERYDTWRANGGH